MRLPDRSGAERGRGREDGKERQTCVRETERQSSGVKRLLYTEAVLRCQEITGASGTLNNEASRKDPQI